MSSDNSKQLSKIATRYNLKLLYMFGSRARGDEHKDSDLDIAYLAYKPLKPRQEANLTLELHQLSINKNIDLIDLNLAPPLMQYMIATEGKKIFGNSFADSLFYCRALRNYFDAKPIFDLTKNYVHSYVNI